MYKVTKTARLKILTISSITKPLLSLHLMKNENLFSQFLFFLVFERPNALLPSERTTLCQTGLTTGGLAKDSRTGTADDDCLSVREDGCDVETAGALHIHEKRARSWDKGLRVETPSDFRI